jgi:predicted DNA-binding antitoxin AbrB/MazE fold protein
MPNLQTYHGIVQKGRIKISQPIDLPEGSEVYVVATGRRMAQTESQNLLYVNPDREAMLQEQGAYQAMLPELLAQYKNQYVAIHQGKVVDHDTDKIALVVRLDDNYPDAVVLIQQVSEEPEKVLRMRSPRLIGND